MLNTNEIELITALSCTDEVRIEKAIENIASKPALDRERSLFSIIRSCSITRDAMQKVSSSWLARFRNSDNDNVRVAVADLVNKGLVALGTVKQNRPVRCTASAKREIGFLYRYFMAA